MAERDSIPRPTPTIESADLTETRNARGGGAVGRECHPPPPFILPRLQMQVEDFCSAGVKLLLGDRRAYACRISDALAHLHVCSTRRADYFAYSSPSLACKCESEDFRSMRRVRLPHSASFKRERDRTCC